MNRSKSTKLAVVVVSIAAITVLAGPTARGANVEDRPTTYESSPSGSSIGGQLPAGVERFPGPGEELRFADGRWEIVPRAGGEIPEGGAKYAPLYAD